MKLIFASMENVNNFIELMNFQGTLSISAHDMREIHSFFYVIFIAMDFYFHHNFMVNLNVIQKPNKIVTLDETRQSLWRQVTTSPTDRIKNEIDGNRIRRDRKRQNKKTEKKLRKLMITELTQ